MPIRLIRWLTAAQGAALAACGAPALAVEFVDGTPCPDTTAWGDVGERIELMDASGGARTVIATSPKANAMGVPVARNLSITLSQPASVTPPLSTLSCEKSGAVNFVLLGGPTIWVLNPVADLQPLEKCTWSILAGGAVGLDENPDGRSSDVVITFATAAGTGDYYATVDASSCTALRSTLHEVIDDHTFFPYTATATDTWDILEQADEDPLDTGRILDVYRNAVYPKAGGGNANYNREHTWPNSYGFNDRTNDHAYTDTHMLYLSNSTYNSTRSNIPYGSCPAMLGCTVLATEAYNGRGGGPQTYPGQHNWFSNGLDTFEVWSGRKGDVARAILYMDIRYEGGTHGITGQPEPDLVVTDSRALIQTTASGVFQSLAYMGLRSDLMAWHATDPPDEAEGLRNELVASYQGNRNPFIDHPEWVECLFNCVCSGPPPEPIFSDGFETPP